MDRFIWTMWIGLCLWLWMWPCVFVNDFFFFCFAPRSLQRRPIYCNWMTHTKNRIKNETVAILLRDRNSRDWMHGFTAAVWRTNSMDGAFVKIMFTFSFFPSFVFMFDCSLVAEHKKKKLKIAQCHAMILPYGT